MWLSQQEWFMKEFGSSSTKIKVENFVKGNFIGDLIIGMLNTGCSFSKGTQEKRSVTVKNADINLQFRYLKAK